MKRIALSMTLAVLAALPLMAQDAETIRTAFDANKDKLATLTFSTTVNAMGRTMKSESSASGVLLAGNMLMVSNQAFGGGGGGIASMFGRGRSEPPKLENLKVQIGDQSLDAVEVSKDETRNLRFFKLSGDVTGTSLDDAAAVPALAEQVLIVGSHDATLNHAKFFRIARINSVVEAGNIYGLDGSVSDCLGALVVTMEGKVIGVVGQKPSKSAGGGGGMSRMLGGLSDPSKAMGNRVLYSAAYLKEAIAKAAKGESVAAPETKPDETPKGPQVKFNGKVASAKRTGKGEIFVLVNVGDQTVPPKGTVLVIQNDKGDEVAKFEVTREYKDVLEGTGKIEQIGGHIKDAEKKITVAKGMKVVWVVGGKSSKTPGTQGESFRGINRFRKVGDAVLGDEFDGVTHGFLVGVNPDQGSACDKAGLRTGDVIYKVGDTEITAETTLKDFWKLLAVEGKVTLGIVRRGEKKTTITIE